MCLSGLYNLHAGDIEIGDWDSWSLLAGQPNLLGKLPMKKPISDKLDDT